MFASLSKGDFPKGEGRKPAEGAGRGERPEEKQKGGEREREREREREGRGRKRRNKEEEEEEEEEGESGFSPSRRSPSNDVPADTGESREPRGGEKSGKARGARKRKRLGARNRWGRERERERERENQPPDASYYDAQGATPRASPEGEQPSGGGGKGMAAAGVAKTLIRSSGHVGLFL